MKKVDLLRHIAGETGLYQHQIDEVLKSLVNAIVKELKAEGTSEVHGLASFKVKHKAARQGRNPRNGEVITVPARTTVAVKATAIQTAIQE